MAQPLPSNYSHTVWNKESAAAAARLSDEQIRWIKELYSIVADERMAFTYDLTQLHSSIQQEAALRGQMEAYEKMLSLHEEAMEVLGVQPSDKHANNASSILNPTLN